MQSEAPGWTNVKWYFIFTLCIWPFFHRQRVSNASDEDEWTISWIMKRVI